MHAREDTKRLHAQLLHRQNAHPARLISWSMTPFIKDPLSSTDLKQHLQPFSHCFSYPRRIQPRGGPWSFFTPRLPQCSFTLSQPVYFLGPYSPGFRTHVSHYDQTPGQPRCIFWLAEVMDVANRKRAIQVCNACTYVLVLVNN